jgi:hypothetical protein
MIDRFSGGTPFLEPMTRAEHRVSVAKGWVGAIAKRRSLRNSTGRVGKWAKRGTLWPRSSGLPYWMSMLCVGLWYDQTESAPMQPDTWEDRVSRAYRQRDGIYGSVSRYLTDGSPVFHVGATYVSYRFSPFNLHRTMT